MLYICRTFLVVMIGVLVFKQILRNNWNMTVSLGLIERFVVWAVCAHSVEVGKKQGKGCTECELFNWIFE
jgi:hypothetical protein